MYRITHRRRVRRLDGPSALNARHSVRAVVLLAVVAVAVMGLRYANLRLLEQRLVDIRQMPDSVVSAGFAISSGRELDIEVASFDQIRLAADNNNSVVAMLDRLFVIDARTKEIMWDVHEVQLDRDVDGNVSYRGKVVLPEGRYILTCAVRTEEMRHRNGGWVSWLDGGRAVQTDGDQAAEDPRQFRVALTGRGRQLPASEVVAAIDEPEEPVASAERGHPGRSESTRSRDSDPGGHRSGDTLVELTGLENDEARFGHFSLRRDTEVRVYAVGEGMSGEMYDFGWIVNTANGRTVWEMRYRNTEHAGGNHKNRLVDTTVSLGRGDYVVYFVTDDSHSYEGWNARRPYDEEAWGITVTAVGDASDRGRVRFSENERWTAIARITRIRNDMRRRVRFVLDRRTRIRVYAMGEGDRYEMYDYAWIQDAETRNTIWEMDYRDSEHAGGASKNRLVEAEGWLPAGEYILAYRSDGSHSPESWNSDPPRDRNGYGATVYAERR